MKVQRIILVVLLILLLALALAGGLTLVTRFWLLSVTVLLISYLWVRLGTGGLEAEVGQLPDFCQVGEGFDEEITVTNKGKLPKLSLRVEEDSSLPGHSNSAVFNLSPGSSYRWKNHTHYQRRGQHYLGSVTATVTDPFGLFSRQRKLGEPQSILVYPATLELPLFESSPINVSGYNTGYQSFSQLSPNASSVREYNTGDSLNHIHWQSTAHTSRLMVKVFDSDHLHSGSERVWIILDMQEAPHLGEDEGSTEEYGVTIAASLLKKYSDSGMQVGLVASGDRHYLFPPERGEEHLWHMIEALALMKATGKTPVDRLVSDEIEYLKGTSTVIIITPSDSERVVATMQQLKNRGNLAVAILLEPTSFGGNANPVNIARNLNGRGIQVYTVRKGDDLARALDNRFSSPHIRYI
ncbi:MAG: DUF58 domain-containing protein [Dehalococcoidales bacterium]|nr:DUF58 domain-containing protein [Dehalococcoidales bacterium]